MTPFTLRSSDFFPERVEVDTAKQFGDCAVSILFTVFAFNYICREVELALFRISCYPLRESLLVRENTLTKGSLCTVSSSVVDPSTSGLHPRASWSARFRVDS